MPLIREEQIKIDKHPFDAWEDLLLAAREGFASIQPESFLRFRWFGLYQQRPQTDPYFMLRLKLPGGRLNAAQLRAIGKVARDYGRGITDITTRQNFQFHWLTIENIPAILEKLGAVGITTRGACGDVTRNITGAPLAGFEADEVDDLQDVIKILHQDLTRNKDFGNLPRKFKISISGSLNNAAQPEINDIGIYGFWKDAERQLPSFAIRVGGGLSSHPRFSSPLPIILRREDIIPAVMAVLKIFRDFGNRGNRRQARMKFLVEDWGVDRFLQEMELRADRSFERCEDIPLPRDGRNNFWGVIPQRQNGFYSIGLAILAGRLTAEQIFQIADLGEKYTSGEFRTTNRQNIFFVNVPQKNLDQLLEALSSCGFSLGENGIRRSLVVCSGNTFCNLAMVEVKTFAQELIGRLTLAFPDYKESLTIHITGCANSCGQYQLADIGLLGVNKVVDGLRSDAFHITVGAGPDGGEGRNRFVFRSVLAEDVFGILEKMVRVYIERRSASENFGAFCARFDGDELERMFSHHVAF